MKDKNIIIIFLVFIILVTGVYHFTKKDTKTNKANYAIKTISEKPFLNETEILIKENSSLCNESYNAYLENDSDDFCISDSNDNCGKDYITIKTESKKIYKIDTYNDLYLLYNDNGYIKIYNNQTKETFIVNIPSNYDNYILGVDNGTNELVGLLYREKFDSNYSFLSFENNKVLYANEYEDLKVLSKDYLISEKYNCDNDYDYCTQLNTKLLSSHKEEILLEYNNDEADKSYEFDLLSNDNATYVRVYLYTENDMSTCSGIYTKDLKLIEKNIKDENMSIDEKGNLYLTKDNKYAKEYNPNGKLIKTSSKYDIKMLINEYIVAIKNNNLILSTINNKEIKIGTWDNKNNNLETSLSGINIDDENNEKELYLIVEDKKLTINDAWKECQKDDCEFDSIEELENQKLGYEYYYDLITKKIGRRVRIIYE